MWRGTPDELADARKRAGTPVSWEHMGGGTLSEGDVNLAGWGPGGDVSLMEVAP